MINISWDKYEILLIKLIDQIKQDKFDHILCVDKSGFILGKVLSIALNIPFAVITANSLKNSINYEKVEINYVSDLDIFSGKILLINDFVNSGNTLIAITKLLYQKPSVEIVKTATIWRTENSIFMPTYYVEDVKENEWISLPFERFTNKIEFENFTKI